MEVIDHASADSRSAECMEVSKRTDRNIDRDVTRPHRTRGSGAVTTAVMAEGDILSVTDGEATTIRIDRGCVSITEQGSVIDHILEAGQLYAFDRAGVALVAAQNDVDVTLLAPRVGPPPAHIARGKATLYFRPLWWDAIAALWPAFMRRASRRSFA